MDKKGSMSLEVVIIAILALLVLIVLTVIFANKMGWFGAGMKHCDTICTSSTQACNDAGYDLAEYKGTCKDVTGNEIKQDAYCCKGPRETT